jgi:hypothetical protein
LVLEDLIIQVELVTERIGEVALDRRSVIRATVEREGLFQIR